MTSFLRWASAFVLIAVVIGSLIAYPRLRDRLNSVPTATATSIVVNVPTPIPATPLVVTPTTADSTRPAVVIQAAPTTPPTLGSQPVEATAVNTPAPIATTSLLPVAAVVAPAATQVTPVVLAPSVVDTPAPASGGPSTPAVVLVDTPTATVTPVVLDLSAPADASEEEGGQPAPDSVSAAAPPSPAVTSATETPMPGPTPALGRLLPTANRAGSLHTAPNATSPTVGSFAAGEALDIVAWFTQGTWYLLANGLWVPADAVDNAPNQLPLVVPTATPTFTPSPMPTYTPLPTVPPQPETTPVPVATSLAQPVCACDAQTYSCVSVDFPDRAAAQACFEYCFRIRGFDVHNLDANLNGQACENLPAAAP